MGRGGGHSTALAPGVSQEAEGSLPGKGSKSCWVTHATQQPGDESLGWQCPLCSPGEKHSSWHPGGCTRGSRNALDALVQKSVCWAWEARLSPQPSGR